MKKILTGLFIVFASLLFVSCEKDLDTKPINASDFTSEKAYDKTKSSYVKGLAKIYYNFANTSDLDVDDGGASELIRAFWSLQELSADGAKCAWASDDWVADIDMNTWSSSENAATYAVYARTIQGITFVNEFLKQTTDSKLEGRGCDATVVSQVHSMRNEARFCRAYFYWMAMDIFGDVPFITEDSPFGTENPKQAKRTDICAYVISELKELASSPDTPAAKSNYPRADKGSVLGLLARVYLNAGVYTGSETDAEGNKYMLLCKNTCEDIFGLGYSLCSKYADLFRGDNGENPDALNEIMFAVSYDHLKTQSYGGTSYLAFSAIASTDDYNTLMGINNGWGGNRVPYEYVADYFNVKNQDYGTGAYTINDDRGHLFYIKDRSQSMADLYTFSNGWSLFKFNNIPHNMTGAEYADQAKSCAYSNVDFPAIRLGEIYLIYAEACLDLNSDMDKAVTKLNLLRSRSHASVIETYDLNYLIAERARELMWEADRRTDLIRWGLFNSGTFLWKWKGGSYDGQAFNSHMLIFAIPPTELVSNTDLYQNPGY